MKNKLLIALSSFFLVISAALGVGSVFGEGKPSLTYVYSGNCRACVVFERHVLKDPEVQKELRRFNYKKVHVASSEVRVNATPTVIIYNSSHKIVRKFIPPQDPDEFLEILRSIK